MSDQPDPGGAGPPNPFIQIIRLLDSWHEYLGRLMVETDMGRYAYRLEGPGVWPHVYVLENKEGAEGAAKRFDAYWYELRPDTSAEFNEAVRAGRTLAAAAGVPFADIDATFGELSARHDAIRGMTVLSPGEDTKLFPDARIAGHIRLDKIEQEEIDACKPHFKRLLAFSDHVQGMALRLSMTAEGVSTSDRAPRERVDRDIVDGEGAQPSRSTGDEQAGCDEVTVSPTAGREGEMQDSQPIDGSRPSDARPVKPPVPADVAEILVRDYLIAHGKANPDAVTIRAVADKTGVSVGGVHSTVAWTAFEAKRKNRRSGAGLREVPLSGDILLTRRDNREDDPSAIAAEKEDEGVWEELLQRVDSSTERAHLNSLPDDKRQELIQAFREQRRNANAAGRGRVEGERSQRS